MLIKSSSAIITIAALAAVALPAHAAPASTKDFSGSYRCEPDPRPCSDPTFTMTQSGNTLDVKSASGGVARGTVTSNVSLSMGPTWNMLGVVLPDQAIQWSNGTKWRKQ